MPPREIRQVGDRCARRESTSQPCASSASAAALLQEASFYSPVNVVHHTVADHAYLFDTCSGWFNRCCSGAADWYTSLPPITRGLLTCFVATGLAFYIGALPLKYMYHSWGLVFKLPVPEVRAPPRQASPAAGHHPSRAPA
jgi:hypothetical protein